MSTRNGRHPNHSLREKDRGRAYAVMLLLAIGAALLGVLVLHKLREQRVLSLVLQEKDEQLTVLRTLLQREQEFHRDAEKKIQEIKEKEYPLRAKKMELDGRVLEMQSTISSLEDVQKALETALQEKRNEIKMLSELDMNSTDAKSQVTALRDLLKEKDAEIEDLRHQLEKPPVNVWSVSTDDPLHPSVNINTIVSLEQNTDDRRFQENDISEDLAGAKNGRQNKTHTYKAGEESTNSEVGKLHSVALEENGNDREEESRKLEDTDAESLNGQDGLKARGIDERKAKENEEPQGQRGSGIAGEKTIGAPKAREEDGNIRAMEDRHYQHEKLESSQRNMGLGQGSENSGGGGLNLERTGSSGNSSGSRVQHKHKGKRWRELSRSRRLGKHGYSVNKGAGTDNFSDDARETERTNSTADGGLQKNDIIEKQSVEPQSTDESNAQDKPRKDMGSSSHFGQNGKQKEDTMTEENVEDVSAIKLREIQKPERDEDLSGGVSAENEGDPGAGQEMPSKSKKENDQDNNTAEDGSKQSSYEDNKPADERDANQSTDKKENWDANEEENNVKQVSNKDEKYKDMEEMDDTDAFIAEAEESDENIESDPKMARRK
ncbi:hypothetical protein Ancab_011014 [Ancistrocladus abbreviatus]